MTKEEIKKKAEVYIKINDIEMKVINLRFRPVEEIYKAYFAGAKENGVIWHDLRKNPDDLPERGHKVIAVYHDFGHTHLFAYLREDWVWTTNGHNAFDGVIAWCEIPRYEVEE